ncbi:MAG: ABC transporter ATP-binding protein/permease [Candidatus Geothermarchaeales archaeon]
MKSELNGVAIRVRGLVKQYGDVTALDGVSFDVEKGQVFAFVGPNGAGKTTTVEILECLREPTAGEASVLGFSVKDRRGRSEIRRRVGVLPQDFNTFELLTVRENIQYFASMYGAKADADEFIELVRLEDKRDTLYRQLSGGLQRRLGIAISLVNDPDVIFLDEPTTGLDPRARREMWGVLEMLRERGKTIFLTTHYMEEAERLADDAAGSAIIFPMMFLSGTFWPIDFMPEFLQSIASVLPLTYFDNGLRDAMIYGNTASALDNTLIMLAVAAFFIGAGALVTKWRE